MTFKYAKFRLVVNALILLVIVYVVNSWRDGLNGLALPSLNLWELLAGVAFFLIALWATGGTHLLTKYVVDDYGLTVRRKFRPDEFIAFKDIKTLRLLTKPSNPNHLHGDFEVRYRPDGKVMISLDHLKLNKEFVRRMNAGYERAKVTAAAT